MSNFTGMDIAQVRELASLLESSAAQIKDITSRVTSKLGGTSWVGNDATRFRDDWQSSHVAALNNVVAALEDACQRARMNADQQEQASA